MTDQNLIKHRAGARETEASLERLDELESSWHHYVEALRKFVHPAGSGTPLSTPSMAIRVPAAELERLKGLSMLPTALASHTNEALNQLTRHNLRTELHTFFEAISNQEVGWDGPGQEVSINRFEAMVEECRSLFETRRRELRAAFTRQKALVEETERAVQEDRGAALALARAQASPRSVLEQRTTGKALLWLYDHALKNWLTKTLTALVGLGVASVFSPLRRFAASLINAILEIFR